MDWTAIWNSVKDFFTNNFWNIITFFAVLVIGIILVKLFLNLFKRIMAKTKMEKVAQGFLYHIMKFVLYLVLILILLSIIGISISGLLTTISAMVLAVGMALQNLITNIANGIVIVTMQMFKKGDFVSVNGVDGSIDDINFLFTTINTTDNKRITIPNSTILNNPVTNYGAHKVRRVDFNFEVAYESDVMLVKKIILDVMYSNGKIIVDDKRKPFCRLKNLNASGINFFANCWVDAEDYWDVYYYVMEYTFNEFKRNNISIPYTQLEVRERKDEVVMPVITNQLHAREDKVRKYDEKFDLENANLLALFKRKGSPKKKPAKTETKSGKTNNAEVKKEASVEQKSETKVEEKTEGKEQKSEVKGKEDK
ncbi:MAG: mechanosensitive ion channel family protein [Christensenellales bacterium]